MDIFGLFSVLPLVIRRFAANARLIAAVLVGAVLASALMSTTSIYTGAIRDLGLTFAIREEGPKTIDILLRSSSQTAEGAVYTKSRDDLDKLAEQRLSALIGGTTYLGRSSTFYPAPPGARFPPDESRPRSHFQFVSDLDSHIRVTEGHFPSTASTGATPPSIEVAIGATTAARLDLHPGDSFDLFPFFSPEALPVRVTIVGLIEPLDPDERFWRGFNDLFDYPSSGWETLPFFVGEKAFFDSLGAYLPGMSTDYWSIIYLDTGNIDARNAEDVRLALTGFQQAVIATLPRTEAETSLPRVLATFDDKLFFTRVPLLVLVLQIAAIVLYYLFMVSTMLVERQTGEIAVLKSRGATTGQVMQIYVVEGLLIFLAAVGLGPPLAATVISLLGQTPPFQDLSGGANLSVHLSGDAYLWAAGGALLAYATLLLPAYQATRRTIVQQRTAASRPPKQSVFTRYYLDLALIGLGAILFYQLDRAGKLTTDKLFGDQTIDPVRLLTPAFFILTIGIVFLRLFPLVLRLLSLVVSRGQGSAMMVGMWQLVRNPVHYSRLILLLMLATAVGTFAASFGSTLDRSYDDRAAYAAGAGLRVSAIRNIKGAGPNDMVSSLQEQTQAEAASPVIRLRGSPAPVGSQIIQVDLDILAVDPDTIDDVAYFRGDFAGGPMTARLAKLAQDVRAEEVVIPAEARYIGLWFNPTELRGRVAIEVELIDATGRYFSYTLGPEAGQEMPVGWYFGVADLRAPLRSFTSLQFTASPPQGPFRLGSISIRYATRVSALEGALLIDELQSSSEPPQAPFAPGLAVADPARSRQPFSQESLVASFDSVEPWQAVQGSTPQRLNDELRPLSLGGHSGIELRWQPAGANPITHGLRPREQATALPALASRAFFDKTEHRVGDSFKLAVNNTYFDVVLAGDFELFPTLPDAADRPALIVDIERLSAILNGQPRGAVVYPDEIWLAPGPNSETLLSKYSEAGGLVATTTSFAALRAAQEKDPLVAAGWEGILFISFAAILLLSAIGFLIYSYLTAQKRTLEFAILRTMGFSRRQIAIVVGFEQFFVIGLGMVAGTLLGLRLGTLMIRYMGVTETGADVVPPMIQHVSWTTIGSAWLVLGAAFLVTIGIVVLLYSRLALHRVLRIGES